MVLYTCMYHVGQRQLVILRYSQADIYHNVNTIHNDTQMVWSGNSLHFIFVGSHVKIFLIYHDMYTCTLVLSFNSNQTQASGCSSRQDYCKTEYSIYVGNLDLVKFLGGRGGVYWKGRLSWEVHVFLDVGWWPRACWGIYTGALGSREFTSDKLVLNIVRTCTCVELHCARALVSCLKIQSLRFTHWVCTQGSWCTHPPSLTPRLSLTYWSHEDPEISPAARLQDWGHHSSARPCLEPSPSKETERWMECGNGKRKGKMMNGKRTNTKRKRTKRKTERWVNGNGKRPKRWTKTD